MQDESRTSTRVAARPARARRGGYRPDIDGLRGLAIALVVVFHVFVGRVSSGVDVFLLIGGIFFFGPQIRNALNPQGLTVVQSFLRIFRRLFPALITVVTVIVVAAAVVYPPTRWTQTGEDAAASLLYFQNFHLAQAGQDYASINRDVSLFQHIWSMSAQLQIYVGSLVVIVLIAMLVRRRQKAGAAVLHWLLVVATVGSFVYAVYLHGADQGWNYYSPLSRFWEIGLGGLFGLWLLRRPLGGVLDKLRWPLGVVGVLLIIGTGVFLEGAAQFPGPWTLVPLAGAALVVLAGNPGRDPEGERPSVGVTGLLGTRPFQVLGRISYSLYLWHWPLLVLATFWFSSAEGGQGDGLSGITATLGTGRGTAVGAAVIVVSLVLAWLTERFIETPLRQKAKPVRSRVLTDPGYLRAAVRPRDGHRAAAAGRLVAAVVMVAAVGGVLAFGPYAQHRNEEDARALSVSELDPAKYPGPRAYLESAPVPDHVSFQPPAVWDEETMNPQSTLDGCTAQFEQKDVVLTHDLGSSSEPCRYGDAASDRVMYLAGGSHSEHYLAALDVIGKQRGFAIVPVLKLGCVVGMDLPHLDGTDYPECATWQKRAERYIIDNPPTDGVFMTSTRPTTMMGDGPDQAPDGYVDVVRRFTEAGIHTWGVRDNPWTQQAEGALGNSQLCLADGGDPTGCGPSQSQLSPVNPALMAYRGLDISNIDLTAAYCRDGDCPAVVGNVQVYRDGNHFTPTWMELMAPELARQMYLGERAGAAPVPPAGAGAPGDHGPLPQDVHRVPKPGEETESPDAPDAADDGQKPETPGEPAEPAQPAVPQGPVDNDGDGYDDYTGAPLWGGGYTPQYTPQPDYGYGYGGGYGGYGYGGYY
jgi:peptidoglycan/LPS O-acetylase OafA/YrhL